VAQIDARYDAIGAKRKEVEEKLTAASGCVAWATQSGWGEYGSLISELVFLADHDFGRQPVTIKKTHYFNGKKVITVRGRGRTTDARAFNAKLSGFVAEANKVLKDYPSYQEFLINHYDVKCCAKGESSHARFGSICMLSTNCGHLPDDDKTIIFAIPKSQHGEDQPTVPPSFKEITYGQFFDLSNKPEETIPA
jgi:hypothetical protein